MQKVQLGLKENWRQFTLLVIINAFVGGMVGLERTILPRIAVVEFHIAAKTAILSFIIVFGIVKAITNYFTGALANKVGRKNLLTIGWLIGLPVPFMLMFADSWSWVIAADRPNSLGVFRLWRDLGYAIGAILTGIIADMVGIDASIVVIGILTIFSSGIIFYRMKCSDESPAYPMAAQL